LRQVVLDTETTGLDPQQGHRIIEIGAVELIDRRLTGNHFHQYLNPERDIEDGALEVHGISREFLQDKPLFADIAPEFLAFIEGAELLIHNAPFDIGFLDMELSLQSNPIRIESHASVLDTLELARDLHPGQRNSLDALCRRQSDLVLSFEASAQDVAGEAFNVSDRPPIQVLLPTDEEAAQHEARLKTIREKSGHCLWLDL